MPRPKLPKNQKKAGLYVKLPPCLIAWLREQDKSNAVLIEEALVEKHGLTEAKL